MKDDRQPSGKAVCKADAIAAVKFALELAEMDKKEGGRPDHEETRSQNRSRPSDEEVAPAKKKATSGSTVTSVEEILATLLSTLL